MNPIIAQHVTDLAEAIERIEAHWKGRTERAEHCAASLRKGRAAILEEHTEAHSLLDQAGIPRTSPRVAYRLQGRLRIALRRLKDEAQNHDSEADAHALQELNEAHILLDQAGIPRTSSTRGQALAYSLQGRVRVSLRRIDSEFGGEAQALRRRLAIAEELLRRAQAIAAGHLDPGPSSDAEPTGMAAFLDAKLTDLRGPRKKESGR